jgi:AcrR family transcriptional regulator
MRQERERVLALYERGVQDFLERTPDGGGVLDIPVASLEGALRHIVAWHLRTHSEDRLRSVIQDILTWMSSYATSSGEPYWSTGSQVLLATAPTQALDAPGSRPGRLPRGRHGLPAGVVTRTQRRRIICGTAEATVAKGYANVTVADIVAAAGISRDVFYEHFADKQHAFLEAQQYATHHIFDTCAAAYFSAAEWPERVWNALQALIGLIAANPAIAHLRIVECYAAGAAAIRSTEDLVGAGAIFLEEGYGYRPRARDLPRLYSRAITGAVFEVIYRHVAAGDTAELPRHLPELTYIALVPFTGREQAIRAITRLSAQPASTGGS